MLGAAVSCQARRRVRGIRHLDRVANEADLGGQDSALAVSASKRAADQFLVGVRPVDIGRVDQCHTEVKGLMDDCD